MIVALGLTVLLGMSGCSTKMTDPEKIFDSLKEKDYSLTVNDSSGSKDVYIKGASDYNIIYMDEQKSKIKTLVITDRDNSAYMYMDNNGTTSEIVLVSQCQLNYSDGKQVENTTCSEDTTKTAEEYTKTIKSYFKDIKTDGKGLFTTAQWYAENNAAEPKEETPEEEQPSEDQAPTEEPTEGEQPAEDQPADEGQPAEDQPSEDA